MENSIFSELASLVHALLRIASYQRSHVSKAIILLKQRLMKKTNDGAYTSSKEPMPGIMIWLEVQK
jgi:hypothetical protein